ncbi:unnamed protein product [Amoebophrya sp. A25]|nr:unnamed protein product [Amoebophrya sp. A25]|eukprot:GSA25T00020265001.1
MSKVPKDLGPAFLERAQDSELRVLRIDTSGEGPGTKEESSIGGQHLCEGSPTTGQLPTQSQKDFLTQGLFDSAILHQLSASSIGRHQFEDAKHRSTAESKMRLLASAHKHGFKGDRAFGLLIFLNLIVLGLETDNATELGPSSAYWWLESFFLMFFIGEIGCRIMYEETTRLITETDANAEEVRLALHVQDLRVLEHAKATQAKLTMKKNKPKRGKSNGNDGEMSRRLSSSSLASHSTSSLPSVKYSGKIDKAEEDATDGIWDVLPSDERLIEVVQPMFSSGPLYHPSWLASYFATEHCSHHAWLLLDILIVSVSVVDAWIMQLVASDESGSANLSGFRVLRMLRVLRSVKLVRYFKDLWLLVNGLVQSMRSIAWVMVLLSIFIYCCALFMTGRVRDAEHFRGPNGSEHPDPLYAAAYENFSTVTMSCYTLFQVVTLENWADLVHPLREWHGGYAFFFVGFIILTHFAVMNLFVGVLVEHITRSANLADLELMQHVKEEQRRNLKGLFELFALVDEDGSGAISFREFNHMVKNNADVQDKLASLNLQPHELMYMWSILDVDVSGELSCEEFVSGVTRCKSSEMSLELMYLQGNLMRELGVVREQVAAQRETIASLEKIIRSQYGGGVVNG